MSEEQGIHPEVVKHLMDHNRRLSTLELQKHDEGMEQEPHEVFSRLLEVLEKLNANIEKLIPAVEADTKADLKEAGADKTEGKNDRRKRERAGTSGASGAAPAEA